VYVGRLTYRHHAGYREEKRSMAEMVLTILWCLVAFVLVVVAKLVAKHVPLLGLVAGLFLLAVPFWVWSATGKWLGVGPAGVFYFLAFFFAVAICVPLGINMIHVAVRTLRGEDVDIVKESLAPARAAGQLALYGAAAELYRYGLLGWAIDQLRPEPGAAGDRVAEGWFKGGSNVASGRFVPARFSKTLPGLDDGLWEVARDVGERDAKRPKEARFEAELLRRAPRIPLAQGAILLVVGPVFYVLAPKGRHGCDLYCGATSTFSPSLEEAKRRVAGLRSVTGDAKWEIFAPAVRTSSAAGGTTSAG
jgi:hypothetical protein